MEKIDDLQKQIDVIDGKLIALLVDRFARSREIGTIKRLEGKPPFDPMRVSDQREKFIQDCISLGLDGGMASGIISGITDQVIHERRMAALP